MNSAAISARNPERNAQELLDEWIKSYFTGNSHKSPMGDVTFPEAVVLFNQTQLPQPDNKVQIHFVFSPPKLRETWEFNGKKSTWESTLFNPASGVSYGLTTDSHIEETVHGKLIRRERGSNIRWQNTAGTLAEQIFRDGAWTTLRTWAGAGSSTAPSWSRTTAPTAANGWKSAGDYIETVTGNGPVRSITPDNPTWDGTRKLLSGPFPMQVYFRMTALTQGNREEFACRAAAAAFVELVHSRARAELAKKGMRNLRIESGPTPLGAPGMQVRLVTATADLHCFVPREGI